VVGRRHDDECSGRRVCGAQQPYPTPPGVAVDPIAGPQSPADVQRRHCRKLVRQPAKPPRGASLAAPPSPARNVGHRVLEGAARKEPRWGGRHQPEDDQPHDRGHRECRARPAVVVGTLAIEPDEDRGRHDKMQRGVHIAGDHREHGEVADPGVQAVLDVDVQDRLGPQDCRAVTIGGGQVAVAQASAYVVSHVQDGDESDLAPPGAVGDRGTRPMLLESAVLRALIALPALAEMKAVRMSGERRHTNEQPELNGSDSSVLSFSRWPARR
jgi:hypothetical protein